MDWVDEAVKVLQRVRNRRRTAYELRPGAISRSQSLQSTHNQGDVRTERASVRMSFIKHHELQRA